MRNLATNPAVAVHLDAVDDALIIHGIGVACRPDADLGSALAAAFTVKYPGHAPAPADWDDGGLHRVVPRVMLAWRHMPTATCWRFPAQP